MSAFYDVAQRARQGRSQPPASPATCYEIWRTARICAPPTCTSTAPTARASPAGRTSTGSTRSRCRPRSCRPSPSTLVTQRDVAEAAERGRAFGVNVAGFFRSELGLGRGRTAADRRAGGRRACPALPVQGTLVPPCRQEADFTFANPAEAAYPISIVCMNGDTIPHFAREVGPGFFEGRHTIALWWWELGRVPRGVEGRVRPHRRGLGRLAADLRRGRAGVAGTGGQGAPAGAHARRAALHARASSGCPRASCSCTSTTTTRRRRARTPSASCEAFKQAFPPGSGAKLALKCINAENLPEHHEEVMLAPTGTPTSRSSTATSRPRRRTR